MPVSPRIEAPLVEVFSSIQGEGVLVGCRQVFLRFAECNLDCAYCDTSFLSGPDYRFETQPGSAVFHRASNPASLAAIRLLLDDWLKRFPCLHHSLVLTGGEPLLHAEPLAAWLPGVNPLLPVFVETNGTLPEQLAAILPLIRWVSMDIKLASTAGLATPWALHQTFMQTAGAKLCQVKIVVDAATPPHELSRVAALMNAAGQNAPLILQPLTRQGRPALTARQLLACQAHLLSLYPAVRVIPQMHPWLGVA